MSYLNQNWLLMSILSLLCGILLLTILLKKGFSSDVIHYESTDAILLAMQRSLEFINLSITNEKNKSIFYSTDLKSFYEYTDWKSFKDSSYIYRRDGDYCNIIRLSILNTKFISEIDGFNTILNQQIPLDRILPDFRPTGCKHWHYLPEAMPKVSVIIALTEENEFVLMRSIYSILLNTPRDLLNEIILVINRAENSEFRYSILSKIKDIHLVQQNEKLLHLFANVTSKMPLLFGETFDLSKIQLLFTGKRVGLAQSLNLGAKKATGDVLVFLQSHIEVSHNWLLPLLGPILDDWRTVSIPNFIDVKPNNFGCNKPNNDNLQLVFWNWGLQTQLYPIGLADAKAYQMEYMRTLPYQLDLVSSSQFAISKRFFRQIGTFDEHYLILDEIIMDLSFKVRQCGGQVLKTHCSNVFVLRKTLPNPMLQIFDEVYLENNFSFESKCFLKPMANRWIGKSNISRFQTIHPTLTDEFCRGATNGYDDEHLNAAKVTCANVKRTENPMANFQYAITDGNLMASIRTNSFVATIPSRNVRTGYLKNAAFSICLHLEIQGDVSPIQVETSYCREKPAPTVFRLDTRGVLRFENYCLKVSEDKNAQREFHVEGVNCFFDKLLKDVITTWQFTKQNQMRFKDHLCLTYRDVDGIMLAKCSDTFDTAQVWQWI